MVIYTILGIWTFDVITDSIIIMTMHWYCCKGAEIGTRSMYYDGPSQPHGCIVAHLCYS